MPRVVIDPEAVQDLDAIYDYIGIQNQSPRAAARFLDALEAKFQLYAGQPQMGELRPQFGEDVRLFSFHTYVVVYRPVQDGIAVLRVFEGHRDYPALFPPKP